MVQFGYRRNPALWLGTEHEVVLLRGKPLQVGSLDRVYKRDASLRRIEQAAGGEKGHLRIIADYGLARPFAFVEPVRLQVIAGDTLFPVSALYSLIGSNELHWVAQRIANSSSHEGAADFVLNGHYLVNSNILLELISYPILFKPAFTTT